MIDSVIDFVPVKSLDDVTINYCDTFNSTNQFLKSESLYPVSHLIVDIDFSAKYSRVASVAMAVGSCRTGPPADRNVLKTFDGICPTIGWESV